MSVMEKILEKCVGDDPPNCQAACPLHIDVRGYTSLIRQGKYDEALALIRQTLPFPGIIGRICIRSCEKRCKRSEIDEPVAIEYLKRAAADYGTAADEAITDEEKDKKVAIVGGGPAGLMAAYDLRKMGYQVTIFEALPMLGGMLSTAIPDYRLPGEVVRQELGIMERLGVTVKLNTKIGLDIKLSDIEKAFDATFVATGATLSRRLRLDGLDLEGVFWGLDFLTSVKLGNLVGVKDRVVVVGGGNVAVDVALTVLRLGAGRVEVVCLERRQEMPAFDWEIEQAIEEGITLHTSWGPKRILGDDGKVTGIDLVRCTSVFDQEGRFNPAFDEGVTRTLSTDMVILAIGQATDLCCLKGSDLRETDAGLITVDPATLQTNVPGVFAGGDVVTGPKSVIDALAAGRKAAIAIDRYLKGESFTITKEDVGTAETRLIVPLEGVPCKKRHSMPCAPAAERRADFREVDLGFTKEQAEEEADRCLQCECKVCIKDCEFLQLYGATPRELAMQFRDGSFKEKPRIPYLCNVCDLCKRVCPEELSVGDMCMEIREQMVASGLGPLSQHKLVQRDQEWSTSDSVTLAQPDLKTGECKRVFFPGCGLSGYSPELTLKVLTYLQEKLPGTGILLGCCGGPTHFLGDQARFGEILEGVKEKVRRLGAQELILACPDCYHTIKHSAPDLEIRSLPEVILVQGLPETLPGAKGKRFSLHDSCKARWEKGWQDSVRSLVEAMGHQVEEMEYSKDKTRCCGMGGMVPYVDFELAGRVTKKRADEASHDILTYCTSCREALAMYKPALHILDLIFNPDWDRAKGEPPKTGKVRRENQARLKAMLENQ